MKERSRKLLASGMLILAFFSFSSTAFLVPRAAQAGIFMTVDGDPTRFAYWLQDVLYKLGRSALIASVSTALINATTYAADRLAYDAAVFVAAGGQGEDPLFDNRSVGDYFSDYGASVAGDALGEIDDTGILGNFSLCEPDATKGITLAFKLGIQGAFKRPEPECKWSEVKDNWGGFLSDVASMGEDPFGKNSLITAKLADAFNPSENDFSVGIQLYSDVLNKAQSDAANNTLRNMFSGFFQNKTAFINGKVLTPAEMVQKQLDAKVNASEDIRSKIQINALSDPDILLQIAKHAGSVFTNTLLSKVTEKIENGLFGGIDAVKIDPFNESGVSSGSSSEDARNAFRSFLTAAPISVSNFSQLGEFSACPSLGKTLYNCVADSSFISAISRAESGDTVTIAQAIEEGLLNSSWALIPSSDTARDQDQFCYTYGYCHGNLVKLRKARIISTGWELAAESTANSENNPVTLGEVVEKFNECNDQGELDTNHPWCHLIDPNWVLKYPETQCKAQVYGEELVSSASGDRQQVCVDMPSCIDEDSEGNCTGGYGYCVREENVWMFRGESCPDYYASCVAYEDPNGTERDFLSNTTNSDNCTTDSAGCLWYATQKVDDGTDAGKMVFPDYTVASTFAGAEAANDIYKNRIYFTSKVAECDATGAGCKELVSRKDGTTLNMVNNPSFETDADLDGVPDGWVPDGADVLFNTESLYMLDGSSAINPMTGSYAQPGISLTQGAEYTLSFYARQSTEAATISTGVLLELSASNSEAIDFGGYALAGDCAVSTNVDTLEIVKEPTDTTYQRYTCTFTVPVLADSTAEITATLGFLLRDVWFDEIQLEQESEATDYHDGYSSSTLDLTYVKVAPTYLGCTGDSTTDAADCANFATACVETDVGCSLYTPSNGDPSVAGITDSLDACPSTCVGYDTFKQEATRYEPDGDFPVYFIPESADSCSAQAVGCDQFTNVATEAASYFTNLRACLTTTQAALNASSSDDSAVFYTWEGSDTAGYQIKTWNLVESNMGASAYTYSGSTSTNVKIDSAPNAAPCTTWTASATGITCDDYTTVSSVQMLTSDDANCDEHDDTIINPDCREFYDANGVIHYRAWSKTVTVNDSCVTYRKTDLVGLGNDNDGDSVDDGKANCGGSGGYFDDVTRECRYYGFTDESFTCSESESGCRDYTGGRSRDSRQAFIEYFEDVSLTNWEAPSATNVTLSNESIATDGHSLSSVGESVWTYVGTGTCADDAGCATVAGVLGGTCTLGNGDTTCGTLDSDLYADKTYTISFWAKGTGTLSVGFDSAVSGPGSIDATSGSVTSTFVSGLALGTGWNEYTYGPLDMNATDHPDFGGASSSLVFAPSTGGTFYIDNVVLREGEDNIDVIKDSWVTPAECDQTQEGTASPQYMLGCQEYTDQNGTVGDFKSFSSLCEESQVGCSSYFMTQESDSTTAAVYGAYCSMIANTDGSIPEATTATSCYYNLDSTSAAFDTNSQFLCTIGVGTTSCEFNLDWYVPAADLAASHPHLSYAASTVISPADKDVFLVVNSDVECTSDVAGCIEVGLPVFAQDHTSVVGWTSKFLMNVPADYATTLCSEKELFCNAWTDKDNTTSYFKDPQDQTCEYLTDVTVGNVMYSGWFKTGGTNELCATDPTTGLAQYVIGGDTSGIWKNGDANYANWVGTCTTEFDSCTEYQDLTDLTQDSLYGDADGTSYFYLNNDALMDNSLPDSQKCNGQASQKEGCGLFNNSSEPSKTSNMSATYVASKHADALFGGSPNGLVDPIDCNDSNTTITTPTGTTTDLCANRCQYNASEYYDINGTTSTYIYDGSCYDNSDCRPLTSEANETISGSCVITTDSTLRLTNDANTVLKVNRDRECSQWLSCSDAQTTWSESAGAYVTICGDIGLCTQYSGTSDASFCSAWKQDDPATVLNQTTYSERDVSWYGEDYSGYAIPGSMPVDQLTQKNIAPPAGYCNTATSSTSAIADMNGVACTSDADCGDTTTDADTRFLYCPQSDTSDYRLAYVAGSCDGDYGDSCTVGYCENTGSPCASTTSCGVDGGSCVVGTCYSVSSNLCASSADCSPGDVCQGGYCATAGSTLPIEDYDSRFVSSICPMDGLARQSLYTSVNFQTGTCMRDECILTPAGNTFNTDTAEAKSCKGYPELNSPFPTSVVSEWYDKTNETSLFSASGSLDDLDARPVAHVQNFENAQTCVLGESCDCSYKKVSYSGVPMYFNQSTEFPVDSSVGVCSGGTYDKVFCSENAAYEDGTPNIAYEGAVTSVTKCTDGGGTCTYREKVDDVLGMDGYCLERDSSTNILGNRDLNACLTWLPVDQLTGSTDLYAKYTSAGYFAETNYCSYVSLYEDVSSTSAIAGAEGADWKNFKDDAVRILCAEAEAPAIEDDLYCRNSIICGTGFIAVIGPRWDNGWDADQQTEVQDTFTSACNDSGVDTNCPLICVPSDSWNGDTSCDSYIHDNTTSLYTGLTMVDSYDYPDRKSPVYRISDAREFTDRAVYLADCEAKGRRLDNGDNTDTYITPTSYNKNGSGSCTDHCIYGVQDNTTDIYAGCYGLVSTMLSSSDNEAAPYTDRILNPLSATSSGQIPFELSTSESYSPAANFAYTADTAKTPFGASLAPTDLNGFSDARPAILPSCFASTDTSSLGYQYYYLSQYGLDNSCPALSPSYSDDSEGAQIYTSLELDGSVENADDPEARAFTDYRVQAYRSDGVSDNFNSSTAFLSERAYVVAGNCINSGGSTDNGDCEANMLAQIFATDRGESTFSDGIFDLTTGQPQAPSDWTDGGYSDRSTYAYDWDVRAENGIPPSVWAVSDRCYNDDCEEDTAHALTVNDQNEGDVSSSQFYRAYLKFYAAADKNQLPIRRVIVDWGDGDGYTGSDSPDNFYKNHRGLNPGEETSICDNSTSNPTGYEWGMTPESCDSSYFSYNHIYTCNPVGMDTCADTNADGFIDSSPCTPDGFSCEFRPRVHVRDNWGWCGGVCTVGGDGTNGCYDNDGTFSTEDWEGGATTRDECAYDHFPTSNPNIDPWVYYDGNITVTP